MRWVFLYITVRTWNPSFHCFGKQKDKSRKKEGTEKENRAVEDLDNVEGCEHLDEKKKKDLEEAEVRWWDPEVRKKKNHSKKYMYIQKVAAEKKKSENQKSKKISNKGEEGGG